MRNKHPRLCLYTGEVLYRYFSGLFCVRRCEFRHSRYADFSAAKFSNDVNSFRFSNPYCGAQFICHDAAAKPNQRFYLAFRLFHHCRGWVANERPVTSVIFTALKTTEAASNWADICDITIHASLTSMERYRTSAFRSKKFGHHSLPSTYFHNIRHFALLQRWTHVTWLENRWSWWIWTALLSGGKSEKL